MDRFLTVSVLGLLTVAFAGCIEEAEPAPAELPGAKIGPASGTQIKVEKKEYTGSFGAAVQDPAGALACGRTGEGIDKKTFDWEFTAKEADGTKTKVSKVVLTLSGSQTTLDNDIYFYDPEGELLGSGATGAPDEVVEITQLLQPGKYKVVVVACTGANSTFKVDGQATYVAA